VIFNPEYDHLYFWDVDGTKEGPVETGLAFPFPDTPDPNEFPEERHRLALTDILEAIAGGREPLVAGAEALKSLAIVLAIEESARTRCEAEVLETGVG
jgi:predicted dehydrogenase